MVLKSLLLQGFKSFPEKTEIRFHEGMTAIVGPNGSGKSNISDAIRWVLGEQSTKSLRGGKMEDVIFSGSAKRRPTGFAEVSLILDNSEHVFQSDFTEIMVTRRYYRSGESEYFLNRKHCRLRDIHELFMDTGLGRDGYSMIGQGKIDEILSQKSEDRREVFEEAAGITKFRYRKEEAERKLTRAEDNLLRIRDIFNELQRQIGPLEKQAEKAKQYLILRDELRVLEVSLWMRELASIKEELSQTAENLRICNSDLTDKQEEQKRLYAESERLLHDMQLLDRDTDALRQQMRQLEQEAAEQKSQAQVMETTIQHNEETIVRMQAENKQRESQFTSLEGQITARRSKITENEAIIASHTLRQQRDAQAFQEKLRESNAQNESLRLVEGKITVLAQTLHTLALERTEAQTHLSSISRRNEAIASDEGQARAVLQAETEKHNRMKQDAAQCLQCREEKQQEIKAARDTAARTVSRLQDLQHTVADAKNKWSDLQNRIKMLSDMQKEYEGFSKSVKITMNRAERGMQAGVHGPVSSLIQTDVKFITAIDVALGASASSIVVDSAADAKACIAHLKKTDGGRATFLPVDTIKPASLRETGLEALPHCYGTADKLTHCDTRYRAIVQNLLARTVIVDTLDDGLKIAKQYGHRFRIVTLDGQVLQVGGAMTGGSLSRGTGALARAGKLQGLQEEQKKLTHTITEQQGLLSAALAEQEEAEQAVRTLEAEANALMEQEAGLRAGLRQHTVYLDALQKQTSGILDEASAQEALEQKYRESVTRCEMQEQECHAEQDALQQECDAIKTVLQALQAEIDEAQENARALETELAQLRAENAADLRAADDLKVLQDEMRQGMETARIRIAELKSEINTLEEKRARTQGQSKDAVDAVSALSQKIEENVSKRQQIEGERIKTDKLAQSQTDTILALQREGARLENAIGQLGTRETQILDKMWERYELTPTPAGEVIEPLENIKEAKARAEELRRQMRLLGNVNLGAVEEYEEALERYTFMGQQKEDLEKSQRELRHIIEKLTESMKEIFASEFAKLNHFFGETFHEIFGGGHAELQLADTSDILSCGIDIIVSPPGKSVKTITLLSGGERAFVAIALYFAILKLRPTPFCVLDEIEAALDDVNVVRYAQYIRKLTSKTQFIVITHRRGTMEEADMLYGVTMQEQGISKLLMLNLVEAEKQIANKA